MSGLAERLERVRHAGAGQRYFTLRKEAWAHGEFTEGDAVWQAFRDAVMESGWGKTEAERVLSMVCAQWLKPSLLSEHGSFCQGCGKEMAAARLVVDHVSPWSGGGRTEAGNLQLLCVPCNRLKGKGGNDRLHGLLQDGSGVQGRLF